MTLPVRAIAARSYGAVLRDLPALARCAAMPAVVMLLGSVLAGALDGSWAAGPISTPFTVLALEWGPGISFAIAWLRWILRGERRPALAAPRYGRRELTALAFSIVLPIAVVAPFAVPLAVGRLLGAGPVVDVAVTVLVATAVAWAIVFMLRTMLLLPLVAIDAGAAALPRSWRAVRGHALAILGLFVLVEVPPIIVQAVVPLAFDDATGLMAWLALVVDTALYFPAAAIGTTGMALAARHLGATPDEP